MERNLFRKDHYASLARFHACLTLRQNIASLSLISLMYSSPHNALFLYETYLYGSLGSNVSARETIRRLRRAIARWSR